MKIVFFLLSFSTLIEKDRSIKRYRRQSFCLASQQCLHPEETRLEKTFLLFFIFDKF